MQDSLKQTVTVESFRTTLIISEILITAIVLVGFYFIFNRFNKKNKSFRENEQTKHD